GKAARNGILFKNAESLENCGKTKIVALDKTGTVTKGQMAVCGVSAAEGVSEAELVSLAFSLESKSEHPIAKAVVNYAKDNNIEEIESSDFENVPGKGIKACVKGEAVLGGNNRFLNENNVEGGLKNFSEFQGTPLHFAKNGMYIGTIFVSDSIKEDSGFAVELFKKNKIRVVMITGDNAAVAEKIAGQAGISEVMAGVLPAEKEEKIRELKSQGRTLMVGDGVNDAPALTQADTGIAIGAGSDVAIASSGVVLVKNSLVDAVNAVKISRAALRNIHQNLFWAFFYNVALIPVAAGVYYKAFGLAMNPMLGAAAMSLSSFCVVTNALRLNFIKLYEEKNNFGQELNLSNQNQEQEKNMKETIKVEGMMCPHCEAHVKEALEKIEGVKSAVASHEKAQVELELEKEVSESKLEKAVTDAGYKYLGK
ncbi:MAG: HAD-IC family P-type ATPase, partial [Treponema sp.]|nr:HAD-IC family P-type ATPase [Candidatus Treponema equifaecale]